MNAVPQILLVDHNPSLVQASSRLLRQVGVSVQVTGTCALIPAGEHHLLLETVTSATKFVSADHLERAFPFWRILVER